MPKKLNPSCTIIVLLVFSFLSARTCKAEEHAPLRVGLIYGMSGPLSELSRNLRNAASLAAEDAAARDGPKVETFVEDSRWDPKEAVSAFTKLVTLNRVHAVHVTGTGMSLAIKPLLSARKVLMISVAAHPEVAGAGGLALRHSNDASVDAASLGDAVAARTPRVVGIATIENEWGVAYERAFTETLAQLLPAAAVRSVTHRPDEGDFRPQVLSLSRH